MKVVTKLGGTVDDSEMVDGMIFDHKPSKVLPQAARSSWVWGWESGAKLTCCWPFKSSVELPEQWWQSALLGVSLLQPSLLSAGQAVRATPSTSYGG